MSHLEDAIRKREKELERPEDALCVGLTTLAQYSSSARASMYTAHLTQAPVPNNPDMQGVFTGREQLFGKYSNSYVKTEKDLQIIYKIRKFKNNDMNYILVVYDKKENKYDVIQRKEAKNMAESFGFRYKNDAMDAYEEGDVIKKNTMLSHSPTLDEYENFMFGLDANVVYLISQETIEDAVEVSEPFSQRASFTKVSNCKVPFNDNDIPLNLYGDEKHFKMFPEIGEWTKDCIICGTRRKDNKTSHYTTKNTNLSKIFPNDDIFQDFGDWQIVDINIWSNKTIDDIPNTPAYEQIRRYYGEIVNYNHELFDKLGDIINNADISGYTYSTALSRLYAGSRDFLSDTCKWVDNDRMFSNMIIEFEYVKSEPLRRGTKISGTCGELYAAFKKQFLIEQSI